MLPIFFYRIRYQSVTQIQSNFAEKMDTQISPPVLAGVPRVWEKIEEKLKELGKKNTGLKKAVMDWAKDAALRHHLDRMAGKPGQRNLKNIFSFFFWN